MDKRVFLFFIALIIGITSAQTIPNVWSADSDVKLPLIDFSKVKTINAVSISKEEKARDKEANKLYQELQKKIRANKDPLKIRNLLEKNIIIVDLLFRQPSPMQIIRQGKIKNRE